MLSSSSPHVSVRVNKVLFGDHEASNTTSVLASKPNTATDLGPFINTRGDMGHNILCDLHNEHVNKLLKGVIRHMGEHFSQKALTSAARSVTCHPLQQIFISSVRLHQSLTLITRRMMFMMWSASWK